jgi:hypothetical protein
MLRDTSGRSHKRYNSCKLFMWLCLYMVTRRWDHCGMPPDVAGVVMEHLKWDRGASAVFRQTCIAWRDAHDQTVTHLSVIGCSQPPSVMLRTRFPRVKEILVGIRRPKTGLCMKITIWHDDEWLRTLGGLTALASFYLSDCDRVSDDGLHTLSGLVALTNLN